MEKLARIEEQFRKINLSLSIAKFTKKFKNIPPWSQLLQGCPVVLNLKQISLLLSAARFAVKY